jgi:hypothetical protein
MEILYIAALITDDVIIIEVKRGDNVYLGRLCDQFRSTFLSSPSLKSLPNFLTIGKLLATNL